MLRNLPEGSRYIAAQVADHDPDAETDEEERDPRDEAVMDHRVWTLDRRLRAMEINALYTLISVSADWKDGKGPDFPTIGPASWQEPTNQSNELKDNFDVLRKMGWPGG